MIVYIDDRTGRVVVEDTDRDDWDDEPRPIVFHPCCRADEIAWWLRLPGRMVAQGKRYGHK